MENIRTQVADLGSLSLPEGLAARLLMVRRPSGAWRLAKNAGLIFLGLGENRPASPEWWQATLRTSGFVAVTYHDVVSEAGIVYGRKPC